MDLQQRQNMKIMFVIMVSAVLCAIAGFVAIVLFLNRAETVNAAVNPTIVVDVSGTSVVLNPDPAKMVILASELGTVVAPEQEQPDLLATAAAATIQAQTGQELPTATPLPPLPTPTPRPPEVIFTAYVVQPGDTLYRISQNYNTTIELMARYGISSVDMIAGKTISLPIANPNYCPGTNPYVVRENDTVFSIALAYGTTADAIVALNGLDPSYSIKITQVICVP